MPRSRFNCTVLLNAVDGLRSALQPGVSNDAHQRSLSFPPPLGVLDAKMKGGIVPCRNWPGRPPVACFSLQVPKLQQGGMYKSTGGYATYTCDLWQHPMAPIILSPKGNTSTVWLLWALSFTGSYVWYSRQMVGDQRQLQEWERRIGHLTTAKRVYQCFT